MKKVLFLLFAVLCLVSCRTATVDDSAELETLVLVVEDNGKGYVQDDAVPQTADLPISEEVSTIPQVESEFDDSILEVQNDDSTIGFSSEVETVATNDGDEVPLDSSASSVEESLNIDSQDGSLDYKAEEIIAAEDSNAETIVDDSDVESILDDEAISDDSNDYVEAKEPLDEAATEPVQQSSSEIAVVPSETPNQIVQSSTYALTTEKEKGCFFKCLLDFILREKLFSLGVLTVFIGLVMLIVALFRNIIRSAKGHSGSGPNCKDPNEPKDDARPMHEDLSMDDEDEFLKSLLNS